MASVVGLDLVAGIVLLAFGVGLTSGGAVAELWTGFVLMAVFGAGALALAAMWWDLPAPRPASASRILSLPAPSPHGEARPEAKPGAPQVGAPQVGAPQVGAPQVGAPQVGAPQVGAPQVGAPQQDLAGFDPLTGMHSYRGFVARLDAHLATRAVPAVLGVILFDLDHLRYVNEELGHDAGDQLIVETARRLEGAVRPRDWLARIGGDELVVVCDGLASEEAVEDLARRCLARAQEPILLAGTEVFPSCSAGVACATGRIHDSRALLRRALSAMHKAKERGGRGIVLHRAAQSTPSSSRVSIESELRRAVERGELRLVYQPVVELARLLPVGAEALLRWQHPVAGSVMPRYFLSVAEETGVIVELGAWALRRACADFAGSRGGNLDRGAQWVSVNVSSRQLADPGFVDMVRGALDEAGIPPWNLLIELHEHILAGAAASTAAEEALTSVADLGVMIVIDRFGTAQSPLDRLRDMRVTSVKVDRTFVSALEGEPGLAGGAGYPGIMAGLVEIAHDAGITVMAEDVETAEQLRVLRAIGCDFAQGFLFSRPVGSISGPAEPRRSATQRSTA